MKHTILFICLAIFVVACSQGVQYGEEQAPPPAPEDVPGQQDDMPETTQPEESEPATVEDELGDLNELEDLGFEEDPAAGLDDLTW